jgi:hypothetical protein
LVPSAVADQHYTIRTMSRGTVIRVFCVDGPCHGEQYLSLETGRILFDNSGPRHHVYRLNQDERIGIRTLPTAYFDHTEAGHRGVTGE